MIRSRLPGYRRKGYWGYCLAGLLLLAAAGAISFRADAKLVLMKQLVHERPLPGPERGHSPDPGTVVYILGGGQKSIHHKFKTAGLLYKEGLARKIVVHRSPGLTEYSPALDRNLTNDEWTVMELEEAGVAGDDVELVSVPSSPFGTFAEARAVSALCRSRGIRRLVLISSRFHLERVWRSFSHFDADNAFELYAYGSEEDAGIYDLLTEFGKLQLYRYIVLPGDGGRGIGRFS